MAQGMTRPMLWVLVLLIVVVVQVGVGVTLERGGQMDTLKLKLYEFAVELHFVQGAAEGDTANRATAPGIISNGIECKTDADCHSQKCSIYPLDEKLYCRASNIPCSVRGIDGAHIGDVLFARGQKYQCMQGTGWVLAN